MTNTKVDSTAELEALTKIAEALSNLDEGATKRVLLWAAGRFGVRTEVVAGAGKALRDDNGDDNAERPEAGCDDVGEFLAAADPTTDVDRALVVAYWMQFVDGAPEFEGYALNKKLGDLGHRIKNITSALDKLKARKPQLVIQTKKSGTSRQSRKKYKVTNAGKNAVEQMLARE